MTRLAPVTMMNAENDFTRCSYANDRSLIDTLEHRYHHAVGVVSRTAGWPGARSAQSRFQTVQKHRSRDTSSRDGSLLREAVDRSASLGESLGMDATKQLFLRGGQFHIAAVEGGSGRREALFQR